MADKRISQLVDRGTIANNDVVPIVVSGATTTNKATISSIQTFMQGNLDLGVTSVGLSMPSAFVVTNSPVTASGNISVTGAGTVSQYIRGDGSLADFPQSGGGGGASVNYYLNGSVSQGTIGGIAFLELSKTPILGAGTDFTIAADGYIASFITDAGDPALLEIPAGNWNFETYFQASSGGGSPTFYVELYKVDSGGTATLIASNSGTPELIAFGTTTTPYFSTLAVPTTTLTLTDRLALRYYVIHSGRTITLHTENATLCQIITTFTTGLTALNGLTAQVQNFATGTSGTDFGISSTGSTHTFNLPTASATNRGALSSANWITFNSKIDGTIATGQVAFGTAANTVGGDNGLFWDNTNKRLGINRVNPSFPLDVVGQSRFSTSINLGTTDNSNGVRIIINNSSSGRNFQIANNWNLGNTFEITPSTTVNGTTFTTPAIAINGGSSNVLIGTTTDAGFRLDVNGTARVQGQLTTTADAVVNGVNVGIGGGAIGSNTRVGLNALRDNTTGANNTAFGINAGLLNTTGTGNSFFGQASGQANTTGGSNSFFGQRSGEGNTVGGSNSFFGTFAGFANTNGGSNSYFGVNAGFNISSGSSNVIFGQNAGRFIADGTTSLTIVNNSIFLGAGSRANSNSETNQIAIGLNAIGLGSNSTVIGNSSTTFGRWFGNLLIGTSTNSTFALDVVGSSRLNGLSTIQGTTASDTAPLGSELATTGTGTNWTGTDFATGYTHTIGSTAALTTTLAAVVNTFYQITYTVTGRTTGSFVINYGGTSTAALTATGATGPRATSTATLEIVPTTDFNGTIVLSVRTINGLSSAGITLNSSSGTITNQIRISSINTNTFVGINSGQRNTTGGANSFFGANAGALNTTGESNTAIGRQSLFTNTTGGFNTAIGINSLFSNTTGSTNTAVGTNSGQLNTTGSSNSFFGASAGQNNTTGSSNSFFGLQAGVLNTTGASNAFFGLSSGQSNTTGASNSFFGASSGFGNTTGGFNVSIGTNSLLFNTTGSSNVAVGQSAGRNIADGNNLTISNNSVFIGNATRALADNQTNQIVIGNTAIGLGSNTTVLGNSSTTFGRWFGNLLIGTSTNNGTNLRVVGTTQSDIITQNLASHGKKVLQYSTTSSTTINLPTEFPLMTGLVVANAYAVFGKFLGKYITYGQAIEFYISKNPNGTWNAVAYSDSSQFVASLVSVTGSGNDITITTQTDTSFILELTVMTQA